MNEDNKQTNLSVFVNSLLSEISQKTAIIAELKQENYNLSQENEQLKQDIDSKKE